MKKLAAIVMLLLAAVVIAQDQPVKMPPLIEQADARYEKIVAEAQAVRLKVYEKALADATRARNAELAQAIKGKMEAHPATPKPRVSLQQALTGTEWEINRNGGQKWHFKPNGVCVAGHNVQGSWLVIDEDTAIARWSDLYVVTFDPSGRTARVFDISGEWQLRFIQ